MTSSMPGFRRRFASAVATIALACSLFVPATPAQAAFGTPPHVNGYTISNVQHLSAGLVYAQYRSSSPRRVINVAFVRHTGPEHFRVVLSNESVYSGTETISSMCRRVSCKIAVNGDFFSRTSLQPAGGMASDGIPIRTPPDARYHFWADWKGNVGVRKISLPSHLYAQYPNGTKPILIHSLNTDRPSNRLVLYTPKWGSSTHTSGGNQFEITLKLNNAPLAIDKSLNVTMVAGSEGGNKSIPSNGMVLSGLDGTSQWLRELWSDVKNGFTPANATINLDSQPDLRAYVGGTPALLQGGKQAFTDDHSSFMDTSDPHTMVGRNWDGDAILAVVDGRQSSWSNGFTMVQAMQFMRSLGASDALNLDGGGSSEFVKNGTVTDKPSDGRERPIAAALTVVP